jgi:hypothetical protein
MLDKKWFDRLQINFREGRDNEIAIHAFTAGVACVYFTIPLEWANLPDFWERLHRRADEEWKAHAHEQRGKFTCPVCQSDMRTWKRRYQGFEFCGFCGAHVRERRDKVELIKSILVNS